MLNLSLIFGLMSSGLLLWTDETYAASLSDSQEGWSHAAARDDAAPTFVFDPKGGRNHSGSLLTTSDKRAGLHGWWQRTVPIEGGRFYQFSAMRKAVNVEYPRRSAVARIFWIDENGNAAVHDFNATTTYREGERPRSEPEYPADGPTQSKRASGKVNRLGETLRNCETSNLFDPAAPIDKDVYHVRSSKTEALQHRLD